MLGTFLISTAALIIAVLGCALLAPAERKRAVERSDSEPAGRSDTPEVGLLFRQNTGG